MKLLWLMWAAAFLVFPACMFGGDRTVLVADSTSQSAQNDRADADNLSRMRDVAMVRHFVDGGYLVGVPSSTRDYYLKAVGSNYRFCRPWTRLFLERISRQFHTRFGDRLRVTSLVRTRYSQRRLARSNGNAADASGPEESSHLTGATIDISKRFMTPDEQEWVRGVLYSLREAGYVYAIEEFYQPTFHVMVYRNYSAYVKRLTRTRATQLAKKHRATPAETADAGDAATEDAQR